VIGHKNYKIYNDVIAKKLAKAQNVLLNTPKFGSLSTDQLKSLIEGDGNKHEKKITGYKLADHLKICSKEANTGSTADLFKYTLDKILTYSKHVQFDEITVVWLEEFEKWLSGSLGVNSTNISRFGISVAPHITVPGSMCLLKPSMISDSSDITIDFKI
jgi:hypothetical protein